jgi:hypothetical protein
VESVRQACMLQVRENERKEREKDERGGGRKCVCVHVVCSSNRGGESCRSIVAQSMFQMQAHTRTHTHKHTHTQKHTHTHTHAHAHTNTHTHTHTHTHSLFHSFTLSLTYSECNKGLDSLTCADNGGVLFCKTCHHKHFGPKGFGFGSASSVHTN